jgi:hypothetical protein
MYATLQEAFYDFIPMQSQPAPTTSQPQPSGTDSDHEKHECPWCHQRRYYYTPQPMINALFTNDNLTFLICIQILLLLVLLFRK